MDMLLEINPGRLQPIAVADTGMVWKFCSAILFLSILAFMRLQYMQRVINSFKAYVALRYLRQLTRDDLNLFHPYSLLTFILYGLSLATFIHFLGAQHPERFPELQQQLLFSREWVSILVLAGVILTWVAMHTFLYGFVYRVLGEDGGQVENRFAQVTGGQALGVAAAPFAIIALFSDGLFLTFLSLTGVIIFVLNYLYRLVRGVVAAREQGVRGMYIIYYLCTLEIVPVAFIGGILMRW